MFMFTISWAQTKRLLNYCAEMFTMCTFVCLCIYMCTFKSMHVCVFQYVLVPYVIWICASAICHVNMINVFVPYAICHADIYMPCAMCHADICHVPGPRERGQM